MAFAIHLDSGRDVGRYFALDGARQPVPISRAEAACRADQANELVARTELGRGMEIRTFFTGIDLVGAYDDEEDGPLLFESIVELGEDIINEGPYRSWAEAEAAHEELVERYETLLTRTDGGQ